MQPPECRQKCGACDSCPDHILEAIFAAALSSERQQAGSSSCCTPGGPDGAQLPLVCQRWRRIYNSSSLLHGTLNLNLLQLEAQLGSSRGSATTEHDNCALLLRLLAQRGRAAHRLWLHSEGTRLRMACVLQLMSPQLQSVYLGPGAPEDSLSHLCRFSAGLRSLDLPAAAAAAGAQMLPGFGQLEELTLREGMPGQTDRVFNSLAFLPSLRLLSLTLMAALPSDGHQQLARLSTLEELHLYLQPSQPTQFEFQPGALAQLTRLRSLLIMATAGPLAVTLAVGPGLPRLPALNELQVESCVESLPPDLWHCQHLTRLDLDLKGSARLPFPASPPDTPCLPSLADLRLMRCKLPGGALPHTVCQLSGLRHLEVVECNLTDTLPSQFSRLTSLEHLSLEANTLCTLPPAVAALPALRHLDLSCNALAWLPQGAYLAHLETLILSANRITSVPPVLADASCLEVLCLSGNMSLELCRHDVDVTLTRMPRLALLCIGKQAACGLGMATPMLGGGAADGLEWRTPSVAALVALGQALPQLQVDFERTAKEYEGI